MRPYLIPLSLVLLIELILSFKIAFAEERLENVALREYEIKEAIQKKIDPYLNSRDYTLKVKIFSRQVSEKTSTAPEGNRNIRSRAIAESLPGFEPDYKMPPITEIVGETYWVVDHMQIDLVVSKSLPYKTQDLISEMARVVSGLDFNRGDRFNPRFIDLEPAEELNDKELTKLEIPSTDKIEEKAEAETLPDTIGEETFKFDPKEWGFLAALILLLIIVGLLVWRLRKLNQSFLSFQQKELTSTPKKDQLVEHTLEEIEKEKKRRQVWHEEQLQEALLEDENKKLGKKIVSQLVGRNDRAKEMLTHFGSNPQGMTDLARLISLIGLNTSRSLFSNVMDKEDYLTLVDKSRDVKTDSTADSELLKKIQDFIFAQKVKEEKKVETNPFAFLKELNMKKISYLLHGEDTLTKAIVISQLNSEKGSDVLTFIPAEERASVVLRIGEMDQFPLDELEKVAYNLADKSLSLPDYKDMALDGVEKIVDLLTDTDSEKIRTDVIKQLRTNKAKLAREVEKRFFLFESIPVLPNDILTLAVRNMAPKDILTAILGSSDELRSKVSQCFPVQNRDAIRAEFQKIKMSRPGYQEIKAKRKLFIREIQKLSIDEKINLREVSSNWAKQNSKVG